MDQLKRNLVCKKISYDIQNNLIENECYELGYTTRYSSGYLAKLLISQFDDAEYDFIIDDSIFNGYCKTQNNEKDKTSVLNFSNYLEQMSKMDLTNIDNKKQLIYKFIEKIFESKGRIKISLNTLKKLAKI